ncbi:unnamed protein product [Prorocentrum cordatum]|uniref:Arpin n=1 Tax=Prorocentrum cordatum TaxID=2364126 RepID=A0ABN9XRQ0_9DINO|nr:unnamed protein product [Polarella glacialis]
MTRPVLEAKMANAGAWAFVELATEQLASTAVALRSIKFDDGTNAVIGWPGQGKDAERHAAPSLLVRTAQLKLQDDADTGALERGGGAGEAPAAEQSYRSDPFEEPE